MMGQTPEGTYMWISLIFEQLSHILKFCMKFFSLSSLKINDIISP